MLLAEPLPFAEALESRAVRQILATEFRTKLLAEIPAELLERAMFSAGVTSAEFLQAADDAINKLTEGTTDRATQRLALKQLLQELQYRPVPGEEGTLTDVASDARLNLILDTNLEMAQGYGHFAQGQDEAILDAFPAQELIRVRDSKVPRKWADRWDEAGGTFYPLNGGNRMIAKKNDPIWVKISRFGLPYPPFDFNSGMDVQDITREEAEELGVIKPGDQILPHSRDFNTDLQASAEVRSDALKEALLEKLPFAEFVGGVLRLRNVA